MEARVRIMATEADLITIRTALQDLKKSMRMPEAGSLSTILISTIPHG